ncbi:ankyrin [Exophiala viscosa]|uniref:Ankyrin n=1 Tax=Exophiala viscosa TaxID=2486360 RepID=A0AAN6E616_9EURO|nr:ankyrin [Exophiala viscosa]
MAPKKGKETLLELCGIAMNQGNSIAVRMLEYLGTVKHQPHGFTHLASDFLDVSRILWSIEAGLQEAARARTQFPVDMTKELDKRFRQTNDDFIVLNQMLSKYLEYERKGRLGRFQRGWHNMFADDDIHKLRDSLGKSQDALRMSALVFRWSLGEAKVDSSIGIGYTGLAAVLERMNPSSAASFKSPVLTHVQPLQTPASDVPDRLPPLPPITMVSEKTANYSLFPRVEDSLDSMTTAVEHRNSEQQSLKALPSIRSSKFTATSAARELGLSHMDTAHTDIVLEDHLSTAESFTQIEDMISEIEFNEKQSTKVVRIKADPSTVPRWTPKQNTGANSAALKTALISAIQQRKHKMVEQLLDCGVPPESGLDVNVLREAVLNKDAESVRLLLLFGADPNSLDRNGSTALLAATEVTFLEAAKLLMKYGGDPNLAAGPDNMAPLTTAVTENKVDLVQLFLTYGGNADLTTTDGNTLLDVAISKTVPKRLVELLLVYGSDPNGKSRVGETPLFCAISVGRIDLMTYLLDHGADPNLPGPKHPLWPCTYQPKALQLLLSRGANYKKCPGILELATSINNIESITILLKAGVDPNAKKDGTYTPLCSAIRDNRAELVSLLLANGADPNTMASEYPAFKCVTHHRTYLLPQLVAAGSDLHHPKGIIEKAVAHNNKDALMYLLEQQVSPNDRCPEGYTALTTAIREDRIDFVDILLANGADPGIRGQDWPICMAVKRPAILKKLLPKVHNPRAVKGVLEMAVVANELESIKLLLAAGVSVEDKNGGVFSPLTSAIREGRKEIVKYLLDEAGAAVNAPGEHLPIIKAIRRYRDPDILEMLLARGADINLMYRGWNAVLQAVENGDITILRLLTEKGGGVDLEAKDESGRTVMEIVNDRGWDEAVTLLLGEGPKSAAPPRRSSMAYGKVAGIAV